MSEAHANSWIEWKQPSPIAGRTKQPRCYSESSQKIGDNSNSRKVWKAHGDAIKSPQLFANGLRMPNDRQPSKPVQDFHNQYRHHRQRAQQRIPLPMLQVKLHRESSLAVPARPARSVATSAALSAHTPRTPETSRAGTPPHRESPEYKWRRTSRRAQCPPTNSAPRRRIQCPSATTRGTAGSACKRTVQKSPAPRSSAHAPKPAPESKALAR